MNYWKGLLMAVVFDAGLVAGSRFLATEPPPPSRSQAILWPAAAPAPQPEELLDRRVDSLMTYLQEHPRDVAAMQRLARLYADVGWHEQAIGPLARALQLDPHRWSLWVALDRALEQAGRAKITDAELARAAQEFVAWVEMRGHGC
jgi:cytochrome c-type biogenesis protein CcmH/NrfG